MRDAPGGSRAAPRHTRGTVSYRSATAPLAEGQRECDQGFIALEQFCLFRPLVTGNQVALVRV